MSVEANGANLLLGRGKLYFDRWVNGVTQGLRFLGDCSKFEIQPSATKKDRYSSTKAASSKIASALTDQSHVLSIDMLEYDPLNVALVLLGDGNTPWAQGTGTVTAEQLTTSSKQGRIYGPTVRRNPTSIVVKVGATPAVLGTDYEVIDSTLGLIRVLPGATVIPDASTVTVDYSYAAYTKNKIAAGSVGSIEGKLVFVGDPTNGPIFDGEFWHVKVFPQGAVGLITDDYGTLPLQAEVVDDSTNHPAEPMYRLTQR